MKSSRRPRGKNGLTAVEGKFFVIGILRVVKLDVHPLYHIFRSDDTELFFSKLNGTERQSDEKN